MNRLLTKYGMVILSIAVVIAVLLSIMTAFSTNSSVLNNIVGTVATPLRTVGTLISNQFHEWTSYFTDFDELKAENEQLKKELADLQNTVRQAEYDREENKLLRELLELREQRRDLTFESALIIERECAKAYGLEIVCVVPQPKAGGSFATTAWANFEAPVAVEHIKAQAGMDIGGTLIGMHLCDVAVPVRLSVNHIGEAILLAARTRPKFIGGIRAKYE